MDTAVYIISYQFETCLEMLPMNILFYGSIHINSLRCVSFLSYHKALLSNTYMVYCEQNMPIFVSETPFRFLTWLRITECGKRREYFSDVQRPVRMVSYLHLSPSKGFYMRKCVYYRFMLRFCCMLPRDVAVKKTTKREAKRNGK